MISIVNTECHVPKTFSDLAKIAAWGRLGLLGAKSMPRDCDCRPSIGYSCIDGKMGAGRLARSSKKPAAPTVSATRTLRFLAGSRRLHSPSIPKIGRAHV